MNLYRISQSINDGYDTYDSAVVAASSSDEAKTISPSDYYKWIDGQWHFCYKDGTTRPDINNRSWALPDNVAVELIGVAIEGMAAGVVCSSFNAG